MKSRSEVWAGTWKDLAQTPAMRRAASGPRMATYLPHLSPVISVLSQTTPGQNSIKTQEHISKVVGTLPQSLSSVPGLLCKSSCFCFITSLASFCLSQPPRFHYFYCKMKTPAERVRLSQWKTNLEVTVSAEKPVAIKPQWDSETAERHNSPDTGHLDPRNKTAVNHVSHCHFYQQLSVGALLRILKKHKIL